jgi:hypothetical protein
MNTRVKQIQPGHYSVQANNGPKTRYTEIGQVWKEGSKWRASSMEADETAPAKKFAVAHVVGTYTLEETTCDAIEELSEREDVWVDEWPEWSRWKKGTLLRHRLDYVGALEHAFVSSSGKRRYGIRIQKNKALICGFERDFKEEEV